MKRLKKLTIKWKYCLLYFLDSKRRRKDLLLTASQPWKWTRHALIPSYPRNLSFIKSVSRQKHKSTTSYTSPNHALRECLKWIFFWWYQQRKGNAWSVSLACNKILKPISICGSSSSGIHCNVATTVGLTNQRVASSIIGT